MHASGSKYSHTSDSEWIELLTATPRNEEAQRYFFTVKCRPFLQYIARTVFNNNDTKALLGEFYEFMLKDDWNVLRRFTGRNGASLGSYLSLCTVRHFIAIKQREDNLRSDSQPLETSLADELNNFAAEEEEDSPPVWQAFERLSAKDQTTLRLLIIDGRSTLDAADAIWPYVKSTTDNWRTLPPKRVQDTIAMLKRRALLALTDELQKIMKNNR